MKYWINDIAHQQSLALTMMFGLTVGTVLTMVLVPTFYATVYRIAYPSPGG